MISEEIQKRIVLVHDSFTQLGGAERVVGAFCDMFPEAPLYALVSDHKILEAITSRECKTSYLQQLYLSGLPFKYLLPLLPAATGSLVFPEDAIILSSSSLFLKGIILPKGAVHIQYIHTPPRFLWTDPGYVKEEVPALLRPFASIYLHYLKKWDFAQSQKKISFIANSKEVQERVKKFYKREVPVVYPFVDTEFWKPTKPKSNYFLMGGRLQAHKQYGAILEAVKNTDISLKVVGEGRDAANLSKQASSNVEFLGRVSDEELRDLYSSARGFIFPPIEDAGMMPLEAASCGTATLGIRKGGSLETIHEGRTGEFFESYEVEEIQTKLKNWDESKYAQQELRDHAVRFGKERFKTEILELVNRAVSV